MNDEQTIKREETLNKDEREIALTRMRLASAAFYSQAVQIGVHPFIEFCGLMNEYIDICQQAHIAGIDFSACSKHSGLDLPMRDYQINYINEKLECIFTGRSVMQKKTDSEDLKNEHAR